MKIDVYAVFEAIDEGIDTAVQSGLDFLWDWFSISRTQTRRGLSVVIVFNTFLEMPATPHHFISGIGFGLVGLLVAAFVWMDYFRLPAGLRGFLSIWNLMSALIPPFTLMNGLDGEMVLGWYFCSSDDPKGPRGGKRKALWKLWEPSGLPSVHLPEPGKA